MKVIERIKALLVMNRVAKWLEQSDESAGVSIRKSGYTGHLDVSFSHFSPEYRNTVEIITITMNSSRKDIKYRLEHVKDVLLAGELVVYREEHE